MPSAEKSNPAVAKVESAPLSEQKNVENAPPNVENASNIASSGSIEMMLSIISNKVRNLEKRKNKLDGYISLGESGQELSSEQQKAIEKYEEVVQQLSVSKEFCKQFQKIASDASKEAKREARKMLFTRQHQETAKIREVLMIQDLLQRLKTESVRSDFLNQRNGACPVNKTEMNFIDKFSKQASPARPNFSNEPIFANAAKASAEIFSFLIDERNREFQDSGFTFEKGKELFNRIQACGYWEKNVKFVETVHEETTKETFHAEKQDNSEVKKVAAPAPAQVPAPAFNNGNVNNMMSVQQQMPLQKTRLSQQDTPLPNLPSNAPNTVTAVENAYFSQIKYSQQGGGQMITNNMPISASNQNDFGTNFSFLQDSELDSPSGVSGSQHKMTVNVIPTKHHQQMHQQQSLAAQQFKTSNFHPQSPIAAVQMYPPGLKVQQSQNSVTHIPVNYQASPQQLNQQNAVSSSQVPSNLIPKQQKQPNNGNQITGYGVQTPPVTSRAMAPTAQYQNPKSAEQKTEGAGDFKTTERDAVRGKEKIRDEYQEQPQIDTWTNETAQTSRSSHNRNNNRSSTSGSAGAKYNNYRNPQSTRNNYNESESGDLPRDSSASGAPGTFFRNNDRYNGSSSSGGRFENRGGSGANYKSRDGNYRAGSGRFAGSASAAAPQGSSNPGQRK